MDKNSNFYKAIEESIIRPQSEKMKDLENAPHKFSEKYNKKIEETRTTACEKNTLPKTAGRKKKISVRTFSIIAAAAVLAGAVTVTASESVRHMIYRLFSGGEDNVSFSSQTESTEPPVITETAVTAPAVTDIPAASATTSPAATTAVTTVTSVTSVSAVSEEYQSAATITTAQKIPVYGGINLHQQPSMMAPSYPTAVSTVPQGSENPQTSTAVSNIVSESPVTELVIINTTAESENLPGYSPLEPTVTVPTTKIVDVSASKTLPPPDVDLPGPTEIEITEETTEETQQPTSDTTYTTTIKLT